MMGDVPYHGWRGSGAVTDYTFIINCHGERDDCVNRLKFDFTVHFIYKGL